jgi:LuxR family transcriptional regulator, regulator of acetate metabolism
MSIFQRIQRLWTDLRRNNTYTYTLDEPLPRLLTDLAVQENRTTEEVQADVLAVGLTQVHKSQELMRLWDTLSRREQDVTAWACLGYTNRQIAARLGISTDTVKSYLQNVMYKFNLHSKTDLRLIFAGLDFSEWERRNHQR